MDMGLCSLEDAESILREAVDYSERSRNNLHSKETLEEAFYLNSRLVLDGISAHVSSDEVALELLSGTPVRLAKRMSELGICSRREAIAMLKETSDCSRESSLRYLKEVVYLRGVPVMDGTGVKVHAGETHIEIRAGNDPPTESEESKAATFVPYGDRPWDEIMGDTIVLNKPIGYVSGQEDHQHVPAVRLLNRTNIHLNDIDKESREIYRSGDALRYDRWKHAEYDLKKSSIPQKIRRTLEDDQLTEKDGSQPPETLSGYACTGRLDIDSTGVLIFTRAGIMAQKLIKPDSSIPKEYIVKVQPALHPTARELESGITHLPPPTMEIDLLKRKGNRLHNERHPLKPLVEAEWLDSGAEFEQEEHQQRTLTMRLVLVEGKKRQIRRMCRELLGWHVVELVRTAVGPVRLDSLPEGRWRPLTQEEVKGIFQEKIDIRQWKSKAPRRLDVDLNASSIAQLPDAVDVIWAMEEELMNQPGRHWTFKRLRKAVEKNLSFVPGDRKKKWERFMKQIVHDNPGMDIQPKGKRVLLLKEWEQLEPGARKQALERVGRKN